MSSISELMAAGDPMLSPVGAEQDMGGLPPPMNTTPMNAPPPQHQQLQQMMAPPAVKPKKKKTNSVPVDMKDAVAVALVAFAVLLPNVQTMLTSKIAMMKTPTTATLLNAIIIAVAFYMLKEHVVGML